MMKTTIAALAFICASIAFGLGTELKNPSLTSSAVLFMVIVVLMVLLSIKTKPQTR